jgi:hypothetical protein
MKNFTTSSCLLLFVTAGLGVKAQELLAPTNMTLIAVSPQALRVEFTDTNTTEEVYIVSHSASADGPFEEEWAINGSTDAGATRSWTFGGYEPLTTVYVKVLAVDIDNNTGDILAYGPPSQMLSALTLEFYQAQPTGFTATSQGNHILLSWTDTTPSGSERDEYQYVMMRANDGGTNYNTLYIIPANSTSFVDRDVLPNTVYTYRLDAENQFGINGMYLENFASASLKDPETVVYPNPTLLGTVTVNLDNQYNKGIVNVVIWQPVTGVYYTTTVELHGSKFTLDAFTSLPAGTAYHLIMTLPDGNQVTTLVFNREN